MVTESRLCEARADLLHQSKRNECLWPDEQGKMFLKGRAGSEGE